MCYSSVRIDTPSEVEASRFTALMLNSLQAYRMVAVALGTVVCHTVSGLGRVLGYMTVARVAAAAACFGFLGVLQQQSAMFAACVPQSPQTGA